MLCEPTCACDWHHVQDGALANQTVASMRTALGPKATAAWNLLGHVASAAAPVTQQLLFSSIAGLLGSSGQGNYAAANALLDAMAAHVQNQVRGIPVPPGAHVRFWRESHGAICVCTQGLGVSSIAWGAWGGVGMAASNSAVAAKLRRLGMGAIQPADGLIALEHAAAAAASGSHWTTVMGASVVWNRLLPAAQPPMPFYAEFAEHMPLQHPANTRAHAGRVLHKGTGRLAAGNTASGASAARSVAPAQLVTHTQEQVAAVVARVAGRAVGIDEALMAAGLDSLGKLLLLLPRIALCGKSLTPLRDFEYIFY